MKNIGRPRKLLEEYLAQAKVRPSPYPHLAQPCLISKWAGDSRRVFVLRHGPLPGWLFVCHHCDVPGCLEDSHVFLDTQSGNLQDCVSKGRMVRSEAHKEAIRGYNRSRKGKPQSAAQIAGVVKARAALSEKHRLNQDTVRRFAFGYGA